MAAGKIAMKKKGVFAIAAVGVVVAFVIVFGSVQKSDELTGVSEVSGGIISLRTAATAYLRDFGETPESISAMSDYFSDTESFEQRKTFFDAVERRRIEFVYRKTGSTTFWVGTPWIVRGNKEYRFYSTESGGVIERESRRR